MVEVATGTKGTRAVRSDYPVEEGLEAGTTKRYKDSPRLKPTKSFVYSKDKEGL